ncbi:serine/threonine-protein kinase [Nocardia asteroides]|uniref:serine/threonine-protein kinase n=1 Tax=Nocardia asteroides TaxID=1824 RepID=UPI00344786D4
MTAVEESFAGYRIEGVLGRGGMGTVYRARHPRLPRTVALKVLDQAVSADPELRRRFEQEAAIVAGLDHPGIVGVFDRGSDRGFLWISMPFVDGTDAARLDPRTPPEQIMRYVAETAAALDYAHSQGVLHRDVKPANILIAAPGTAASRAVLTDFGIARLLAADTGLTATGTFTATLAYASPEQLAGETVDHRSDQYSLACTLFALLAGQPPFPAMNPAQVIAGHLSRAAPPLSTLRPGWPPALDAVLARAMAKQRADRFGSCTEFVSAARAALLHNAFPGSRAPAAPRARPRDAVPTPSVTPAAPVSGTAAKTAAVVGILLGLFTALVGFAGLHHLTDIQPTDEYRAGFSYDEDLLISRAVVGALLPPSAPLVVGGVILLLRRRIGALLTAAGAAWLVLVAVVLTVVTVANGGTDTLALAGLVAVFALLVYTGARSTETTRWLAHRR